MDINVYIKIYIKVFIKMYIKVHIKIDIKENIKYLKEEAKHSKTVWSTLSYSCSDVSQWRLIGGTVFVLVFVFSS